MGEDGVDESDAETVHQTGVIAFTKAHLWTVSSWVCIVSEVKAPGSEENITGGRNQFRKSLWCHTKEFVFSPESCWRCLNREMVYEIHGLIKLLFWQCGKWIEVGQDWNKGEWIEYSYYSQWGGKWWQPEIKDQEDAWFQPMFLFQEWTI